MNGNPFYVSPLGGLDLGQTVGGIYDAYNRRQEIDEQKALQQTQKDEIKDLAMRMQQGDIAAGQEFYSKYPERAAMVDKGMGVRDANQAKQIGGFFEKLIAIPDLQGKRDFLQKTAGQTPFTIDDDLLAMDDETLQNSINITAPRYLSKEQVGILQGKDPNATAAQRERAELIKQASSDDPVVAKSARIALGLDPRATGSAQQTIAERGTAEEVAKVAETIEGGKEQGKLMAQLKLEPQVKAAVQTASLAAQAEADSLAEKKSNDAAWKVYELGLTNLADSLGKTATGPGIGLLPALTSEAQTADGAVALMAPLLKQIFRTSGEGTFTDQDQKMLMAMVPTRSDSPEARKSKLSAIDSVIRAKLKQGESTTTVGADDNANDPLGLGI